VTDIPLAGIDTPIETSTHTNTSWTPTKRTTFVFCNFRQVGFHQWAGAPDQYAYLRSKHRHEFHVRVQVAVNHDDRDMEFCHLKQIAQEAFRNMGVPTADGSLILGSQSCEMMARRLGSSLQAMGIQATSVEVSEDGENGALVIL